MERTVLVTGGTRGIGAATAKMFKAKGCKVGVNYGFDEHEAEVFHQETGIHVYKWNVADPEACIEGVSRMAGDMGTIDILVNNAGVTKDRTLRKLPVEDWRAVIETDLSSCFYMCRAVIEGMQQKKFGRIVNISSISGEMGNFGQTNYAAAKAGILGFTKALALEAAADGITVNAVAPGFTKTHMLDPIPADILESIVRRVPVKRLGVPEDIARAVVFLADDDAGFITGATLNVNGGLYMD